MRRSKSPPVLLSKKAKKLPLRPGAFLPSKLGPILDAVADAKCDIHLRILSLYFTLSKMNTW